jgi:ribonuclease P protein component
LNDKNIDFKKVRETGCVFKVKTWMLVNFAQSDLQCSRFGLTIPRYVGIAVIRNRLRRWCREYFRKKTTEKDNYFDINIVFLKKTAEFYRNLSHEQVDIALGAAMQRIKVSR